jgi:hypothetical protein
MPNSSSQKTDTLDDKPEAYFSPPAGAAQGAATCQVSFAQQRLWTLDRMLPRQSAYVVDPAYRVVGALDVSALHGALNDIVARHDVLRIRAGAG